MISVRGVAFLDNGRARLDFVGQRLRKFGIEAKSRRKILGVDSAARVPHFVMQTMALRSGTRILIILVVDSRRSSSPDLEF
jgi:hypothetical protein